MWKMRTVNNFIKKIILFDKLLGECFRDPTIKQIRQINLTKIYSRFISLLDNN